MTIVAKVDKETGRHDCQRARKSPDLHVARKIMEQDRCWRCLEASSRGGRRRWKVVDAMRYNTVFVSERDANGGMESSRGKAR